MTSRAEQGTQNFSTEDCPGELRPQLLRMLLFFLARLVRKYLAKATQLHTANSEL